MWHCDFDDFHISTADSMDCLSIAFLMSKWIGRWRDEVGQIEIGPSVRVVKGLLSASVKYRTLKWFATRSAVAFPTEARSVLFVCDLTCLMSHLPERVRILLQMMLMI